MMLTDGEQRVVDRIKKVVGELNADLSMAAGFGFAVELDVTTLPLSMGENPATARKLVVVEILKRV